MSSESRERAGARPDLREFSFGGVVFRGERGNGEVEIAVIVPRGKATALALPKGGAAPGESGAETAAREVREETGLTADVRDELGEVTYWYRRGGRRIHKTVRFYLCEYVSGTTADHDHEVTEVRWLPLAEALDRLSYPGERDMVRRARLLMTSRGEDR